MGVYKRKDGRWQVGYRDEQGTVRSRVFPPGRDGKRKAEAFDLEVKLLKKQGKQLPLSRQEGIYLDDLAQRWVDQKKAEGKAKRWLKEWAQILNKVFIPAFSDKPCHRITQEDVVAVVAAHYSQVSQPTRNRYIRYLKTVFAYGVDQGHLESNPLRRWKRPKEEPRKPRLNVADLEKIMRHAAPHLQWSLEALWNLGCRAGRSELFALKWEHVDYDKGGIHIFGAKTNTWRFVPCSQAFMRKLWERQQSSPCAWVVDYEGKPINKIRRSLGTACQRAGITYDVRLYDVRHLFASTLLSKGADLAAVSALLGHADITTTQRHYYHLLQGEKQRAVELLPTIGVEPVREERKVIGIAECSAKRSAPVRSRSKKLS